MTAEGARSLDQNRLLGTLAWGRLAAGALVLVVAPLLPDPVMPDRNAPLLALALMVAGLSSAAVLSLRPFTRPGRVAWLVSVLDIVLVTSVVAATGGPRSIYVFLYVLSVIAASLLLPRAGALAVAASGSLLYTGLVFGRTVFPDPGPAGAPPRSHRARRALHVPQHGHAARGGHRGRRAGRALPDRPRRAGGAAPRS